MLAADTNVLVRLLVSDDLAQQRAVARRLSRLEQRGEGVLVTPIVLAELSWVLDSAYGYGRAQIAAAIDALLNSSPFVCPEKGEVVRALELFGEGPADFSDYLVVAITTSQGSGGLLTFDKRLLRHPSAERP